MSAQSRWLRLNVDWDDSPWVFTLSAESQLAWIKLLCHIKRDGVKGKCKQLAPIVASRKWGIGEESVVKMLQCAINDGALESIDGHWIITNWCKYQEVDNTNYERQKRYRTKKNDNGSVTDDNGVTPVVTVARTETETETETETDIKDKSLISKKEPFAGVECPPNLLDAAHEWADYRKERRLSPSASVTWKKIFKKYENDPDLFRDSVDFSIEKSYQGIFPPNEKKKEQPAKQAPRAGKAC